MAENSKIQWTHHTFNPWRGCTKVSEGCRFCYAEVNMSVTLHGVKWGPQGTRVRLSDSGWREPLKWDRAALAAGERRRVFCASLADVFEDWKGPIQDANHQVLVNCNGVYSPQVKRADGAWPPATMDDLRRDLFSLIERTPHLDWLLLTKRPENMNRMAPESWRGRWPANVWAMASVENQQEADRRVTELLNVAACVRGLSCEPLLGPLRIARWLSRSFDASDRAPDGTPADYSREGIDWVIAGGESGPHARPFEIGWVRSLVRQCHAADVACFVKQLGAVAMDEEQEGSPVRLGDRLTLSDPKGGDMDEWPEDLRVREFPAGAGVALG